VLQTSNLKDPQCNLA